MAGLLDVATQFLLVAAVAFLALAGLVSYLRFEHLMQAARAREAAALGPRERFALNIGGRLARPRAAAAPFCVLLADAAEAELPDAALDALRRALRRGDELHRLSATRAGLILDLAPTQLAGVAARLLGAAASVHPVRLGAAGYPAHGLNAADLASRAEEQLAAAATGTWRMAEVPPATERELTLEERRLRDPLTGVLRPEKAGVAARRYLGELARRGRPAALALLDVYEMKAINDRFGRDAGDRVLRGMAGLMEKNMREADLVGRVRDDQFMIIADLPAAGLAQVVGRVLDELRRAPFAQLAAGARLAVNVGIAGFPEHGRSPSEAVCHAEMALEAAFQEGRNTRRIFDASLRRKLQPRDEKGHRVVDRL